MLHYAHYSKGEDGCGKPGSTESNQLTNPSSLLYLSPSENDSLILIGDDIGIWILSLKFGEKHQSVRIYSWLMCGSANPPYSELEYFFAILALVYTTRVGAVHCPRSPKMILHKEICAFFIATPNYSMV